MNTTFHDKKMISLFHGGQIVTDFEDARVYVTSGPKTTSLPFGGMSLGDFDRLVRKTELRSKPVSKLTANELEKLLAGLKP
ncbi:hypothetical protein [Gaoshiqia sp. Z1-71]|uniref:hypothetical protein n=1 Tax=Gaoshiqia hydrogeniformans TaxID=3290090 RepID=UPI003BF85D58